MIRKNILLVIVLLLMIISGVDYLNNGVNGFNLIIVYIAVLLGMLNILIRQPTDKNKTNE